MRLALAGDTMLGRGVAERLAVDPPEPLFSPGVIAAAREADLVIVNLECCISARGRPGPGRMFQFRAPPEATGALTALGVDCVTLANNHALDFGPEALLDTLEHLRNAGIRPVGAGPDRDAARAPAVLEANDERLRVVGVCDHPAADAATPDRLGVAFADLANEPVPGWLAAAIDSAPEPVLVCPHWGPNMVAAPVAHVRRAAAELRAARATLVAGHSAHVFHGVAGKILFDLGDFVDDYRVDAELRNDLGLLWLVDLDDGEATRVEAVPLKLDFCYTRIADSRETDWIARRFVAACAELGSRARLEGERLVVDLVG